VKVVCDTNVLISGILFEGHPRTVIRMASRGLITNAISPDILREVQDVLSRPKFSLNQKQILGIVSLFLDTFEVVVPAHTVTAVSQDPDDNRILEAAQTAGAELVVSGDRHLLDLTAWQGIRIVSPAQLVAELGRT